jgi:hypothetical protein
MRHLEGGLQAKFWGYRATGVAVGGKTRPTCLGKLIYSNPSGIDIVQLNQSGIDIVVNPALIATPIPPIPC